MQHKKTINVPAKKLEMVEFTTCDICGERINKVAYEISEIEVRHKTGTSYPEGGNGEEVEFDICGKCFDEKLVPWLKTQGAEPRKTDWDW